MKKRGMIELQFHWIFVLIAGAVIFIFFINIINKQREYSETKISATITTNLDSILTGAQISTSTVNVVDIPKADIGFECDRYFIGPVPKQTKGNVIFSPGLLKGKQLITWALDWSLPYRVTNFLYLTDPLVRYVIVYDGANADNVALADKLVDDLLPKEMNIELKEDGDIADLEDKNNYKVKFIFLGDFAPFPSNKLSGMPDEDITAIKLPDIAYPIPPTGEIKFLKKQNNNWGPGEVTYYLKKESLFGAIFAEDLEMYNCVMRKAFKKLNLVSQVYYDRSSELVEYYGVGSTCYSPHINALTDFDNMRITSKEESNNFPANGLGRMKTMRGYSDKIKHENQRAQLFSCALIY